MASSLATTSSLGGTANAVPGAYDAVTGPLFRFTFQLCGAARLENFNPIPKKRKTFYSLFLGVGKHPGDFRLIRLRDQNLTTEMALGLGCL